MVMGRHMRLPYYAPGFDPVCWRFDVERIGREAAAGAGDGRGGAILRRPVSINWQRTQARLSLTCVRTRISTRMELACMGSASAVGLHACGGAQAGVGFSNHRFRLRCDAGRPDELCSQLQFAESRFFRGGDPEGLFVSGINDQRVCNCLLHCHRPALLQGNCKCLLAQLGAYCG